MNFAFAFFIAFIMIFVSELGDKTQLIVLSFCNKLKCSSILIGVALGTFLSHGLAILFGSRLGLINDSIHFYLCIFTYTSFVFFGVYGFLHTDSITSTSNDNKFRLGSHSSFFKLHLVFLIAISIFVGELGDKTFLTSLGLGVQYPLFKFPLILGSILGMVTSNGLAIWFGKFLDSKVNPVFIQFLSNLLFIIFGVIGFFKLFILN